MTASQVALVVLVAAVGSFIQGSAGFGHNLIAAPVFALVDERLVPGPAIASAGVLVALTMLRDRKGIHLGEVGTAVVGRLPGTAAAAIAITTFSEDGLALFFGAVVLVAVGITASGVQVRPTSRTLVAGGFLSGFMGTATSIGGPPMAMLYVGEQGRRMRGTMAGFFLTGIFMSIGGLALAGEFGVDDLRLALLPVPGILVGFALSSHGTRFVDAGRTRPVVLGIASLSAVSVILKTIL